MTIGSSSCTVLGVMLVVTLAWALMVEANDIIAMGSKSASRIYTVLGQAFNLDVPEHRLLYYPYGSSEGSCRIKFVNASSTCADGLSPQFIDWAAVTDRLYEPADYVAAPDLQLIPAFAIAVVPVFNLPGVTDLNLPRDVLGDMFRHCKAGTTCPPGDITRWDDSRIIAANPHIDPTVLTDAGLIKLVVRSDGSGTTEIFKRSLASFSTGFAAQVAVDRTRNWANVTIFGAYSNQGVSARVKQMPSSIGYVTLEEATASNVAIAAVGNSQLETTSGFLRANQLSATNALFEKGLDFGNNGDVPSHLTADMSGSVGSEAWPIMGYNYFGFRMNSTAPSRTCDDRFASYIWLEWFFRSPVASRVVSDQGFIALPDVVRNMLLERVRSAFRCSNNLYYQTYTLPNVDLGVEPRTIPVIAVAPTAITRALNLFQISYRKGRSGFAQVSTVDSTSSSPLLANASLFITDADPSTVTLGDRQKMVLDFAATAWGVIYNFCDVSSKDPCFLLSLVLTPDLICDIVSKRITMWNDTRIIDVQENVTLAQLVLPHAPIYIVGYNAGSQERQTFASLISPKCAAGVDLSQGDMMVDNLVDAQAAVGVVMNSLTYGPIAFTEESLITQVARLRQGNTIFGSLSNCSLSTTTEAAGCWPLLQRYSMILPSDFTTTECTGRSAQEVTQFADFVYSAIADELDDPLFQFGMSRIDPAHQRSQLERLTCYGQSILNPIEDKQYLNAGSTSTVRVLASLVILGLIGLMFWLMRNRKDRVLRASQVMFSYQMVIGFGMQILALFTLTLQDDGSVSQAGLDAGCMATVWLVGLGFCIVYIALVLKAYRVWRIFDNPKMKQYKFDMTELLTKAVVIASPVVLMLILWTALAPFKYIRRAISLDESTGDVRVSVGECYSNGGLRFLGPILFYVFLVASLGLYFAWKNRMVPSEFSEGVHVSTALLLNFELILLLIPVLVLVAEDAYATFIVKVIALFLIVVLTAVVFFGPKILIIHGIWSGSSQNSSDHAQSKSPSSKEKGGLRESRQVSRDNEGPSGKESVVPMTMDLVENQFGTKESMSSLAVTQHRN